MSVAKLNKIILKIHFILLEPKSIISFNRLKMVMDTIEMTNRWVICWFVNGMDNKVE